MEKRGTADNDRQPGSQGDRGRRSLCALAGRLRARGARLAMLSVLLAALVGPGGAAVSHAQSDGSASAPVRAAAIAAARGQLSLDQAVARVRAAFGGRVVAATPVRGGYRIRVLLDGGRVKTVFVDAASGSIRSGR